MIIVRKLSFGSYKKARHYIIHQGRDLERELLKFYFENGSSKDVISKLQLYQGEDGGFRNMGEGDTIRTSAMDTSMAFQYLNDVGATSQDKIVQKGIQYIIDTYDYELNCWQPSHNEKNEGWHNNPCAELVGYLYEYKELVSEDFLNTVTEKAIESIRKTKEPFDQFYFLEALCILRMAVRVDEPYQSEIKSLLKANIYAIIDTNPNHWSTIYCAKPFFFANSPNSPLFNTIKDVVILSLENEVETQDEVMGNFILNWSPKDNETEIVWKSIWTMDVLRALHNHDMIEYQ